MDNQRYKELEGKAKDKTATPLEFALYRQERDARDPTVNPLLQAPSLFNKLGASAAWKQSEGKGE